tara:strand:- start:3332 stop:4417 length:1086 start_codon:yes stop_codon:yes gene_type:complete
MFGVEEVTQLTLVALYTDGHILLEGNPGTGKTEFVKSLAKSLNLPFGRIQFTPDLMPSDVTGTEMPVFGEGGIRDMQFQAGPIFTSLLLADEINRATPKTQAAMLEGMAERQVTVLGKTRPLGHPFMVLATQNPIDQEGTYNLPEAQADRFMFKVVMPASDRAIIRKIVDKVSTVAVVAPGEGQGVGYLPKSPDESRRQYEELKQQIKAVTLPPAIYTHIENLFLASHGRLNELAGISSKQMARLSVLSQLITYGLGPRASIAQALAAKAWALFFLPNPDHATANCLAGVTIPTLRHRLKLEAGWENSYRSQVVSLGDSEDLRLDKFLTDFSLACAPVDHDYQRSFRLAPQIDRVARGEKW